MNFVLFNFILFCFSYGIDFIALDIYGLELWSSSYINYLVFINFPLAMILTYLIIGRIKEFLGINH